MNLISRMRQGLSRWIAPSAPAAPAAINVRSYAGAKRDRLSADWNAQNTSADSELRSDLSVLRARSRELERNNEHALNAIRIVANNVIKTGIGLQARVMSVSGKHNERVNARIEEVFETWSQADHCHTAGKLHFHDIERLMLKTLVRDGEVLIRKVRQPFGASRIPLSLEIIEADRLADQWQSARAPNGNMIRMGVEMDQWMRPVAYWLHPGHPGDIQFSAFSAGSLLRIPADEIFHLYIIDRWPQTRGEPWFHATLKRMRNVSGYEEAEVVAARASASIMGLVESAEMPEPDGAEDNKQLTDLEPGVIEYLNPGEKFQGFSPTRPNAALEAFMRHMLRSVAAGIGCSYAALTRDYSQANYSSERAAQLEDRILWRILQGWFIRNFRQQLHKEFIRAAVLGGELPFDDYYTRPEKYEVARFKPPGWSWVDPTKEVAAFKEAIKGGMTTLSDVIAQTGDGADPEEIFRQRREELDLLAELGLSFDTDPGAQAQAAPPAKEEPEEPDAPSDEQGQDPKEKPDE